MLKLLRILSIFIILLLIVYFFLGFYINLKGKDFVLNYLKNNLDQKIEIGSVSISPLFKLNIEDITADNITIKKLTLSPSFKAILGKIGFHVLRLQKPDIQIVKTDKGFNFPFSEALSKLDSKTTNSSDTDNKSVETTENLVKDLFFNHLLISQGKVEIKSLENNNSVVVENITVKINNFGLNSKKNCVFKGKADLKTQDKEVIDNIKFSGWINFYNKSMKANFDVDVIPYGNISFLFPYFLRSDFLGIDKIDFSLKSEFTAENNELTIDTNVYLLEYCLNPKAKSPSEKGFGSGFLQIFNKQGCKVPFNFKIKTKFDNPDINIKSVKEQAIGQMGTSISGLLAKEAIKEVVNEAVNVPGDVVNKASSVINKVIDNSKVTDIIFNAADKASKPEIAADQPVSSNNN